MAHRCRERAPSTTSGTICHLCLGSLTISTDNSRSAQIYARNVSGTCLRISQAGDPRPKVSAWSGCSFVFAKAAMGARVTDFVLRDASGDYLFVELESPTHVLFAKKGKPRAALEHAIDQIVDWKRYLAENVGTVQRELGLTGISTNPRALVVIGRSSCLTEEHRRKLTAIENRSSKAQN